MGYHRSNILFYEEQDQWLIQNFPELGAPIQNFAKISEKLHEIERIWTRGARIPRAPLRSTNEDTRSELGEAGFFELHKNGNNANIGSSGFTT